MTARPSNSPSFATDATFTSGTESGLATRLDPGAGFRGQGWYPNRRMPARWFNYLIGVLGDWASYVDEKTQHIYSPRNYGTVDTTGATNARAAIQDAIDDAGSDGGGLVQLPAGVLKYDQLNLPPGVSLRGVPNATFLANSHATGHQLTFTGTSHGAPVEVADIRFLSSIVATGHGAHLPGQRSVQFRRCSWNGYDSLAAASANLQGKIVNASSALCEVALVDCDVNVAGNVNAIDADGLLRILGGRVAMPNAFSSNLVTANNEPVDIDGVYFDLTGHGAATTSNVIRLLSTGKPHRVRGSRFRHVFSANASVGISAAADVTVIARDNAFKLVTPYAPVQHAADSQLEFPAAIAVEFGSVADAAVPARYRSVLLRCRSGAAMNILMPAGIVAGQELLLTYWNDSVSTVAGPTFATTATTATTVPSTIAAGQTLTGVFVWEDRDVTGIADRWVQKGTWGLGSTIV